MSPNLGPKPQIPMELVAYALQFKFPERSMSMAMVAWLKESLDRQGSPYEERHHRNCNTAFDIARKEHAKSAQVAKVVVAMVDSRPLQLVLPADHRVDVEKIRAISHSENVRLANEEEIRATFKECDVGGVPPIRHWKDVDLWMDISMNIPGDIFFPAGTHRDAIRMNYNDWFLWARPRIERFAKDL